MFIQLKDYDLDESFLKDLSQITKTKEIQDWFVIYKNMETNLDHNGVYSIDSLFVLSNKNLKEIIIYFAQIENDLNSNKYYDRFQFIDFLEQKSQSEILFKLKNLSHIYQYTKNFQSFMLNNKLEYNLIEKHTFDKKLKL